MSLKKSRAARAFSASLWRRGDLLGHLDGVGAPGYLAGYIQSTIEPNLEELEVAD